MGNMSGQPIQEYTALGTTGAITVAAVTGKVHYITDILGYADSSANSVVISNSAAVLYERRPIGSSVTGPFAVHFDTPLRCTGVGMTITATMSGIEASGAMTLLGYTL